jgi:hypothetical protein
MSKLWTAVQSHYRPTAAYLATVVLIEAAVPARAPLPVLSRGPVDLATGRDRGVVAEPSLLPPLPTITDVTPTSLQPAATIGATVDIAGHHLDGAGGTVILFNDRFGIEQEVGVNAGGTAIAQQFTVPDLPVGNYQLAFRVIRPGEATARVSNQLAVLLGPEITTPMPMNVARDAAGNATIAIDFRPQARAGQKVSLLFGVREIPADPITVSTGSLSFLVTNADAGEHLLRLRIDGIESSIINRLVTPPVFLNNKVTIT